MRGLFCCCLLLLFAAPLLGQDLLVTHTGDSLNCKITKVKPDYIYFTFRHKEEIRSTLLPVYQVVDYRYNYFQTGVVPVQTLSQTVPYSQFSFGIRGGWGHRTAPVAEDVPPAFKNYIKKLKSGTTYGADVVYYFSEIMGAGFTYSGYHASNEISNIYVTNTNGSTTYGRMSDDIRVQFAGPSFNVRMLSDEKNNAFLTNLAIGYLSYKNNAVLIDKYTIKGNTLGLAWGAGYMIGLSRTTALEFQLSILSGTLNQLSINDGRRTTTRKLEEGTFESLSRIDLTVGLRFNN